MIIKKIFIVSLSFLFIFFVFEILRPKIQIYGSQNNKTKVQTVMDFYDKYYDGDVSLWYVNKFEHSIRQKMLEPKKYIICNYPIFYDRMGSKNFIIMYYTYTSNNLDFHRIYINAELLYFSKIEITLDDSGIITNSYIKKYPWSNKEDFFVQ